MQEGDKSTFSNYTGEQINTFIRDTIATEAHIFWKLYPDLFARVWHVSSL